MLHCFSLTRDAWPSILLVNLTGLKSSRNLPLKVSIRVFSERFGWEWTALCLQEAVFCVLGPWTEQKEESILRGKAHPCFRGPLSFTSNAIFYSLFPFICSEIQVSVSSVFPRFLPGAYFMCSYCICGCIHFCDIYERYLTSFVYSYHICDILFKYMLNIFNLAYYMHLYYIYRFISVAYVKDI